MITTKCGNQYTEQEWAEMMAQWDTEVIQAEDYLEKMELIIKASAKMLEAIAGKEKAYAVATRIWQRGTEGIQFSNEENENTVEKIANWMQVQERKIR